MLLVKNTKTFWCNVYSKFCVAEFKYRIIGVEFQYPYSLENQPFEAYLSLTKCSVIVKGGGVNC